MREQVEAYIEGYMGEEFRPWIEANKGDEELVMAATINQWQMDAMEMDEQPIPDDIYEWAQSITTSTRV